MITVLLSFALFLLFNLKSFSQTQNYTVEEPDSFQLSIKHLNPEDKIDTLFHTLNRLWGRGSEKSLRYAQQAETLAKEIPNDTFLVKAKIYKANALESQGNVKKATEVYLKIITQAEKLELKRSEAIAYNNIGHIHLILKERDKACQFLKKALKLKLEINDTLGASISYNNLGIFFKQTQQYDSAMVYLEKNLTLRRVLINSHPNFKKELLANSLTNLGRLYSENPDLDKAKNPLNYFNEALSIRRKVNDRYGEIKTISSIGQHYARNRQPQKALTYFLKTQTLNKALNNLDLEVMILFDLYSVNKDLNLMPRALEYHEQYKMAEDSLLNIEKMEQIAELETRYETEKKEKENIVLKSDIQIQQLKIKRRNSIIIILLATVIVIVLLLVFAYQQYYRKRNAYRALVKQNKEQAQKDLDEITIQKSSDEKIPDETISEYADIVTDLLRFFKEEKPYLHHKVTLDELAKNLETNRSYLSKAINTKLNKNLNELVNEYRLKEARILLMNCKYNHISMEGIGHMVGFASRSTFYSNFKKEFGISPSYFRQSTHLD